MMTRSHDTGSQRGAAMPSPVVLLSVIAVILAAVAFVATRDTSTTEREITATKAAATPTGSTSVTEGAPTDGTSETTPAQEKPKPKPIVRKDYDVLVFNNTAIKGLAADVAAQVEKAGWKSAIPDNWKGTVLATTVYYPEGKRRAAQQLALDLGVARVLPADVDSDMSTEKLTLILTGKL